MVAATEGARPADTGAVQAPASARVTLRSMPLWRIRLRWELGRYLLNALSLVGLLAAVRFAVDPPHRIVVERTGAPAATADLGAQAYASEFARAYLTWTSGDPAAHQLALERFTGTVLEPGAGMQPPAGGSEHVRWTEVVQEREPLPGEHVYTVAVQTDRQGLLYLAVSVLRRPGRGLALAAYPAFVGAPAASAAADLTRHLHPVQESSLLTVVSRALGNYLAGAETDLAADLTPHARVSLPGLALRLTSVTSLQWASGGGAVIATVQARDREGAQYELAYELDVARSAGRWEISAIQMDPDS